MTLPFCFSPSPRKREGMMNRLEFSSYVSSEPERAGNSRNFFFLSSFPVFYLFGFLCKKVTLFGNGQQQQQQQQLTASSHFCVVLLSSSSESQLSGWQALFSTSIITVPFICLPLRCQVHPDLSSLRQRPAAAYLKNPAR